MQLDVVSKTLVATLKDSGEIATLLRSAPSDVAATNMDWEGGNAAQRTSVINLREELKFRRSKISATEQVGAVCNRKTEIECGGRRSIYQGERK